MSAAATKLRDRIIADIIEREGGFVDDPKDSGGATKYGVTERVARLYGYDGPMRDMPVEVAQAVYEELYWNALRLDRIHVLSPEIAEELADTGVNMGVGTAAHFLQRALNALNVNATVYPDLILDNIIGPASLAALAAYLKHRPGHDGLRVLLDALNSLQGVRYIEIAEARPKDERFVFGWFRARVGIGGPAA
jgi:lysozyme family protein